MDTRNRDEIETRLQKGLGEFVSAHSGHNFVPGKSIGVMFYKDGDPTRPVTLRQAVSCTECSSSYVGPAYAWLNRGRSLTAFGALVAATPPSRIGASVSGAAPR